MFEFKVSGYDKQTLADFHISKRAGAVWEYEAQVLNTLENRQQLVHGREAYLYRNGSKIFSGVVGSKKDDSPREGLITVGRYHISSKLGWPIFASSYGQPDPRRVTYINEAASGILADVIYSASGKGVTGFTIGVCPTNHISIRFEYEKCGYDSEAPPGVVGRLASELGQKEWKIDDDKKIYISGTLGASHSDFAYQNFVSHEEESLGLASKVYGLFSYDGISFLATNANNSAAASEYGKRERIYVDRRVEKMSNAINILNEELADHDGAIHRVVVSLPTEEYYRQSLDLYDRVPFSRPRCELSGSFRVMGVDQDSVNTTLELSKNVSEVEKKLSEQVAVIRGDLYAEEKYGSVAKFLQPILHNIAFSADSGV